MALSFLKDGVSDRSQTVKIIWKPGFTMISRHERANLFQNFMPGTKKCLRFLRYQGNYFILFSINFSNRSYFSLVEPWFVFWRDANELDMPPERAKKVR